MKGQLRRQWRLIAVLGLIAVLVMGEGALVVVSVFSPSASSSLSKDAGAVSRFFVGRKHHPGIPERVGNAIGSTIHSWFNTLGGENAKPVAQELGSGQGATFEDCVSCHPGYASTKVFSSLYFDHTVHAQIGVKCAVCHTSNVHPDPNPPAESTCAQCHKQVNEIGECQFCHAPGSVPHFYLLGYPRDQAVDCSTCHPKNEFTQTQPTPKITTPVMTGTDRSVCLECHTEANCSQCHATNGGSPHPPNWIDTHWQAALNDNSTCMTCHTTAWCAETCHAGTPKPAPVPPPQVPLQIGGDDG